ncbi:MAG: purS [Ignavibacteria bacterium]|nr:purS [Ignavibacteria bacterium]
MKFSSEITITLRNGILDVQGKTVENALHSIEFPMLTNIKMGKFIRLDVEAPDKESAYSLISDACNKLIANPIIEDYKISIIENQGS